MKNPIFILIITVLTTTHAFAKLNVLCTTQDLKSIAETVGKDLITVDSIAKGTQDPHFIEAKPSYMVKASKADLVFSTGLDLEIGWLPSIIQGARNPDIRMGSKGYLEASKFIEALEVLSGKISRSDGDVHPGGNPHFTLDPIRAGQVAVGLAVKLGELDPSHSSDFKKNAEEFQKNLENKTKEWKIRIEKSGIKKVVTYHKTLTYFLNRFGIENSAILEPKPGIPPTSGHIMSVIDLMKREKIKLVLVENYFDPSVTKRITQELKDLRAETIAVSVEGASNVKSIIDLYETLTQTIEKK